MKKFLTLGIASVFLAGAVAVLSSGFGTVHADEPTDNVIKAVAKYDFDDENNIGKDTSGNGFDLSVKDTSAAGDGEKGVSFGSDGEQTFVKLRRTGKESDNMRGGILYAPFFKGTYEDFSDILVGSFTVTMKFRGVDIPSANGSYYLLHTGKYNNAIGITPWSDHIEILPVSQKGAPKSASASDEEAYAWTQSQKKSINVQTNDVWNTVTIVGNQEDGNVKIYNNGLLTDTVVLDDAKVLFSAGDLNRYTFTLGGQSEGQGGNASTMYGSADIDYVRVYDVPLSEGNVKKLYNGEEAVIDSDGDRVTSLTDIDFSKYDMLVTDSHTVKDIKDALPKTAKATTSAAGRIKSVNVYWYETDSKINGYLQCKNFTNESGFKFAAAYGSTVRFTYDDTLINVIETKIDDEPFIPGTDLGNIRGGYVTFKIEIKVNGAEIKGFYYDDLDYTYEECYDEDEGVFYMEISGPADIVINSSLKSGKITYYDGSEELGTGSYTMGGSEELKTFEKEGYEFVGWYKDSALKNKFEALDYNNPTDIVLYAKYKKIGGKKGCGGNLNGGAALAAGVAVLAAAFVVCKKKEN